MTTVVSLGYVERHSNQDSFRETQDFNAMYLFEGNA